MDSGLTSLYAELSAAIVQEFGNLAALSSLNQQLYSRSCTATVFTMMKASVRADYRKILAESRGAQLEQQRQILAAMDGIAVPRPDLFSSIPLDQVVEPTEAQRAYMEEFPGGEGSGAAQARQVEVMIQIGIFDSKEKPKIFETVWKPSEDTPDFNARFVAEFKQRRKDGKPRIGRDEFMQSLHAPIRESLVRQMHSEIVNTGRPVHADVGGHSVLVRECRDFSEEAVMSTRFLIHDPWHAAEAWFSAADMFGSSKIYDDLNLEGISRNTGIEALILPTA